MEMQHKGDVPIICEMANLITPKWSFPAFSFLGSVFYFPENFDEQQQIPCDHSLQVTVSQPTNPKYKAFTVTEDSRDLSWSFLLQSFDL